ncbi:MAG TPA: hypothetical protein VF147_11955 [Vicinamibacterales bacterium]
MHVRNIVAFAAFALLAPAVPAHADVVWLLKEQAGVRVTLEWTDPNLIRQRVTDSRTATLEEGGSDWLHAEAAIVPASPDDKSSASYGIDYIRQGASVDALVNGAQCPMPNAQCSMPTAH